MTIFLFIGQALVWRDGRDLGTLLTAIGAVGWIGYAYWRYSTLPDAVEKRFSQMPELDHPITYEWDADHFCGANISTQARRPWSYYVKLKDGDEMFLLYYADHEFQVIPKRWFSNPDDLAHFLEAAKVPRA